MSLVADLSPAGLPFSLVVALLSYGALTAAFLWLLDRLFRGTVKPSTGVARAHTLAVVATGLLMGGLIAGVLYGFAVAPALRRGVDYASVDGSVRLFTIYLVGLAVLLIAFAVYCLRWQRRENSWFTPLGGLAMATSTAATCMMLEISAWAGLYVGWHPAVRRAMWGFLVLLTVVSIFGWVVARRFNPTMADKPPQQHGDDN
jgi:hypothetical protein